ncbi:MAG: 3-dehydroquinate synthase [Clostridia bacterium]|nr:3-dehydroquinate synthase [Clostridia bacterium]
MRRIHVEVSKPYDVLIGRGLIGNISGIINPVLNSRQVAIVTDDIVQKCYLDRVVENLEIADLKVCSFSFPNGEQSKNIETLSSILEFLASNHIRRNDTLVALGGGVVGDIAGLAASLYMRGVNVIQIPTTLLAAVDSSVGGKTAVNLLHGKNLAGAFWQPSIVVCDVDIIEGLPNDIFSEGMAEVIKCNVIKDLPIISWIIGNTLKDHLEDVIYNCVELKREIVEQDEYDNKGIRNVLNVGHTIAHAIEKLSDYTISHGRAVGTGIVIEAQLANELGICDANTVNALRLAISKFNLCVDISWSNEELFNAMQNDKKNRSDQIVFELPISLGKYKEIRLNKEQILSLLNIAVKY